MKSTRGLAMLKRMSDVASLVWGRRQCLPLLAVVCAMLAGCSPPSLTRSVVVQRTRHGTPVHAKGHVHNDTYTVVRGDTLYSIAFRVGEDFRDIARWNGISSPYIIHPGQSLRLTAPAHRLASRPSAPVFRPVHSSGQAGETVVKAGSHAGVHVAGTAAAVATATPAPPTPLATPGAQPSTEAKTPVKADASTHSAGGISWQWPAGGKLIRGYHASDAIPGIQIAGHAGDPVRAAAEGTVVYSGNGLVGYGELIIIKHSDEYLSAYGHNSKRLVKEGEHVKAGQLIARMGASGASRVELQFQIRRSGKPVDPSSYLPSR
ncbi:peptidoglycan DD-metalloendopeptidase family protein [Oleiagrimonas sp. C23AA]|uniref:peptidoglycan DD-metalloendopeptidase family protein n=1 Tax=Oleiagrimonas sp. C23AA TaxID=2719047 RepID=UPI001F0D3B43|nr:peptidoglycan DD-metalloendopeptidase family protein [Oleiagrimonas sp. C23AA]